MCEGETEKGYFIGMKTRGGPNIDVVAPCVDHMSVVREACGLLDEYSDENDQVWCVLDTELDPGLVRQMCEVAGTNVKLALSTPCFDFWLLIHHKEHTAPFQSARDAERAMQRAVPGWTKGATRFADFRDGVEIACSRARRLDPSVDDHLKNPSTSVWKLVHAVLKK